LPERFLIKNIITLLFGSTLGQGFLAVATLLTARALGREGFGHYTACFGIASLTSTAFMLGLDSWLLQQGRRTEQEVYQYMTNSLLLRLILGIPWLITVSLLAPSLNSSSYPSDLIWLAAGTVWIDGLLATCLSAFKATLRNHLTSTVITMISGGLFFITIFLIIQDVESEYYFALGRLLISLSIFFVTFFWLYRRNHLDLRLNVLLSMLKATVPFALSELLMLIYLKVDIIIIASYLNETATGIYSPASSLITALFLVPSVIYMVTIPSLGNLVHKLEEANSNTRIVVHQIKNILTKLMLGMGLLGLFLTLGTWLSAELVVQLLLGPSYEQTGQILQIMSLLLLAKAGSFATAAVLVAGDRQHQRVRVQTVIAILNLGLNLFVVQWAGIKGVAWVYVLTELLLFVGYAAFVWQWWGTIKESAAQQATKVSSSC
jgi:O-antigen/teichoic acid export membrane protein